MKSDLQVGDRVERKCYLVRGTVAYVAKNDEETTVVEWDDGYHEGFRDEDIERNFFKVGRRA